MNHRIGSGVVLVLMLCLPGCGEHRQVPELVRIEPGAFAMGSAVDAKNEQPVHEVSLTRPFWIGAKEVTQDEYENLMGSNPSYYRGEDHPESGKRPVESVSWHDAMAYCAALTAQERMAGRLQDGYQYRLPTEAEWEFCCRAGTTTEWNTGATITTSQANFDEVVRGTKLVGSHAANAWGLFDMHGNVWEWCLDGWDGSANYPSVAVKDPYVAVGASRVFRGGAWIGRDSHCRSAYRGMALPGIAYGLLGFRVVLGPTLVP